MTHFNLGGSPSLFPPCLCAPVYWDTYDMCGCPESLYQGDDKSKCRLHGGAGGWSDVG